MSLILYINVYTPVICPLPADHAPKYLFESSSITAEFIFSSKFVFLYTAPAGPTSVAALGALSPVLWRQRGQKIWKIWQP